jgi:hypothetical protein
VIGDAAEHLAQVGFGIEAVELDAFNKGVDRGGALAAGIGAGEQIILPAEGNLADIMPISGRMSSSTIAGIRFMGKARVAFRSSGALRVSSCTWSWRRAS